MKIINQFRKLKSGSKLTLRFRKYPIEVFLGNGSFDYGVEIKVATGKSVSKEYEKFLISTENIQNNKFVIIKAVIESQDELEVFAYLIEYILFELSKKDLACPADIKKYIDDWLKFSRGNPLEISIEKQIGLIGELVILSELIRAFEKTNQLNNWNGPEGSKIDFIFGNKFGLEVKSRIQPFKDWILISSAEQLDNELESQHLAVCDFLPSDSGKSLKQFADEVIILLDDSDKTIEFIEKMRKAKYDFFANYSNLMKVNLFKQTYYDTKKKEFPILKKGIDLRIDKIKYEINISGLNTIDFNTTLAKVSNQQEHN
jgi:hypothetical protein